jgi:hypothetical protein
MVNHGMLIVRRTGGLLVGQRPQFWFRLHYM